MSTEFTHHQVENLAFMLDLPPDLRERVTRAFMEVSRAEWFAEGADVVSEGDRDSDTGYVLLRGTLSVTNTEGFTKVLQPPALIGEMMQFGITGSAERMASVKVTDPATVLAFTWPALYDALDRRLTPEEHETVRDTLRRYAWMHFLEMEDEL